MGERNEQLKKTPESGETPGAKKENRKMRWRLSIDAAGVFNLLRTNKVKAQVLPVKDYEDFATKGPTQQNVEATFDQILEGQDIQVDKLTYRERLAVMILAGRYGSIGYDAERQNDPTESSVISIDEYLANTKRIRSLERRIERIKVLNPSYRPGEGGLSETTINQFLEDAAAETGVDKEELRKIWENTGQNLNKFEDAVIENHLTVGVCRDIAVFQREIGKSLGFKDVFVTSNSWQGLSHVLLGFRDEKGNIAFINYDSYIDTGTPNMKMALSILEGHLKGIALQYVAESAAGDIIAVQTLAAEVLESMARGTAKSHDEILDQGLNLDQLEKKYPEFAFIVERNKAALELTLDSLAGSVLLSTSFHRYEDQPANSIASAKDARVAQEWQWKHGGIGLAGALASINMKQIDEDSLDRPDISRLLINQYANAHASFKPTENMRIRLMAMMDLIIDQNLQQSQLDFSSAKGDFSFGQRYAWILPNTLTDGESEIFIDLKSTHSLAPKSVQESAVDPGAYKFLHELLATGLGANIDAGLIGGYRVRLETKHQIGGRYLNPERGGFVGLEYSGNLKSTAVDESGSQYGIDAQANVKRSNDFRLGESNRFQFEASHGRRFKNVFLRISAIFFDEDSVGKYADDRLDQIGGSLRFDLEL